MSRYLGTAAAVVGTGLMILSSHPAQAQCEWQWPLAPGGPWNVRGLLPVKAGELPFESGPVLFAGGYFSGDLGNHISKWDGTSWSPLGEGLPARVRAMAVFNGELYAGCKSGPGQLNHGYLAKWDGEQWSVVADTNADVKSMLVFDEDGAGPMPPALYIGGQLEHIDDLAVNGIARWDGTSWSDLGGGVTLDGNGGQPPQPGLVKAMIVYEGALLVGGWFTGAGGVGAHNVARWDGSNWAMMGDSPDVDEDETVQEFEIVEGALYASVCYPVSTSHLWFLAKWSPSPAPGGTWTQVGQLGEFDLDRMEPFDYGAVNGESLHISGYFEIPAENGLARNIARWEEPASTWAFVAEGCCGSRVWALTVFDDDGDGPSPPDLYAGGAKVKKLNCDLCTTDADCEDQDPCTDETCDSLGGCVYTLPACGLEDGCCGPSCDDGNDPDCLSCSGAGDLDCDGDVDGADLAQCLGSWGPYGPCPPYEPADLDQDCTVDAGDLAILLGNWG